MPSVHCEPLASRGRVSSRDVEEWVAGAALASMLVLLLVETLVRPWFGFGITGSLQYVRQLTLWVALLGAALAARDGRLLALATGTFLQEGWLKTTAAALAAACAAAVAVALCQGSVMLVLGEDQVRHARGELARLGVPERAAGRLRLDCAPNDSSRPLANRTRPGRGRCSCRARPGTVATHPRKSPRLAADCDSRGRRRTGRAAVCGAGRRRGPPLPVRRHATGGRDQRRVRACDTSNAAGHSDVHAGRVPAGRRRHRAPAASDVSRTLRMAARWHGDRLRGRLHVCDRVHRWIGRHHSCRRGAAAAGLAQRRLRRAVLDRLAYGFRVAGPSVAARAAPDPVRHRRGDSDRRTLPRWPAARLSDDRHGGVVQRVGSPPPRRASISIRQPRSPGRAVAWQMGAAVAGACARHLLRRLRHDSRDSRPDRRVCVCRAGLGPSQHHPRSAAAASLRRIGDDHRRRPGDPRRRLRLDVCTSWTPTCPGS